jgi:phenylpyruvate tautomerase PptA (4-oxalocrotonate tautomerase family)
MKEEAVMDGLGFTGASIGFMELQDMSLCNVAHAALYSSHFKEAAALMPDVTVEVQRDHLERLATAHPIEGVTELIWNALDADCKSVKIDLIVNDMGGVETVCVSDNGDGISFSDAESAFKNLGGSTKAGKTFTKRGRRIHGKRGQGRFRAFSIGDHIEWKTRYKENGKVKEHSIVGSRPKIGTFTIDNSPRDSEVGRTGTDVRISHLPTTTQALTAERIAQRLTEEFALYLRQYPDIRITYNDTVIDPTRIEKAFQEYPLNPIVADDGKRVRATLTIIEWKKHTERSLHLCDADGFSLAQVAPEVRAPGFDFTSYLRSDFFRELADQNALIELNPVLAKVTEVARDRLRKHFKAKEREKGAVILQEWKTQNIYPYSQPPKNKIEKSERQVFDVIALNVNEYLANFDRTDQQNKRLTLQLLRTAIEQGPTALRQILQNVLNLPRSKQEEFARLLDRASLTAVINAASKVADRLNFLEALKSLVFDPQSRQEVMERKQLHKILETESWIFGESFNLALSDKGLTKVLNEHLKLLGRKPETEPVKRRGIVDLMMSKVVSQEEERQHLVVELKRPKQPIDLKVTAQMIKYAVAVSSDPRFLHTSTEWVFWAVSRDVSDEVKEQVNQANRPRGLLHEATNKAVRIWVKSWGELIRESEARLQFFRQQLEYSADDQSALDYLRRLHQRYLPASLADE